VSSSFFVPRLTALKLTLDAEIQYVPDRSVLTQATALCSRISNFWKKIRTRGDFVMKKLTILGAALLLCTALSFGQGSNSTSSPSRSGASATSDSATASSQTSTRDQNSSMSGNTVQGCLSGNSGSYMLTDATGVTYQLQGDDSQFSANANKEVEVMGTLGATASASSSNAPDATPAGSGASGPANGTTDDSGSTGSTASSANANAAKTLTVTSIHKVADSCPASQTPQQ
jgi:hypothetical protein